MRFDAQGLEVLERLECLELLSSVPLGRVVFTDRALPAIQAVNFALDGDDVIIRAGLGSRLGTALRDTVVAFEADAFDQAGLTGWSVTVVGQAEHVDDPDEAGRLSELPSLPPSYGPDGHLIRISGRYFTGNRLSPPPVRSLPADRVSPNGRVEH